MEEPENFDITSKAKLIRALQNAGVRPSAYSVTGAEDLALCLTGTTIGWEVFYFERGSKSFSKTFGTESDACTYMYHALIEDKTSFM